MIGYQFTCCSWLLPLGPRKPGFMYSLFQLLITLYKLFPKLSFIYQWKLIEQNEQNRHQPYHIALIVRKDIAYEVLNKMS
jgi:hypothetical protein